MSIRAYKFRLYPSRQQEKKLAVHLFLAKNLWNQLLSHCKQFHRCYGKFPTRQTLQIMVKDSGLFSQASQEIAHRVESAVWRHVKLHKAGKQAGFPRFKSIDRMKSLHYPQFGFSLGQKLKVTPFGEIAVKKHREIKGMVKTLTLKRESSGRWFAIFTAEVDIAAAKANKGPAVGMDVGLKNFATFSDGRIIENPRHIRKCEEKLAFLQKELSNKKKGSKNRRKARLKVARAYESMANARHDFLHKAANSILSAYSLIALEELAVQEMAQRKYGKWINDAAWNMFSRILAYKAESAGCKVVFVNPKGTTKECSACGREVSKTLRDRMHLCPACGLNIDRDLNASINILNRATVGITGSNACGDGGKPLSLKQEACASKQHASAACTVERSSSVSKLGRFTRASVNNPGRETELHCKHQRAVRVAR